MVPYALRTAMIFVMAASVWLLRHTHGGIETIEQALLGAVQAGLLCGALVLPLILMEYLIKRFAKPPLKWLLILGLPLGFGLVWHVLAKYHALSADWPVSIAAEMLVWAVTFPLQLLNERTFQDYKNGSGFRGSYLA